MGNRRTMALGLGSLSSLLLGTGCMFLVDFDELKGASASDAGLPGPLGGGPSAEGGGAGEAPVGTGGSSGMGGSGATGGSGGELCPDDCNDGLPCTEDVCGANGCENPPIVCTPTDTCNESVCVEGQCVESPTTGVVLDGFEDSVTGDEIHRTTLVAGADRFFHAVYGVFGGGPDLLLGAFDATGTATARAQSLADGLRSSNFEVASPAALVADERDPFGLHVYVGVRGVSEMAPPDVGEVLRIVFNRDVGLVSTTARRQGTAPSYLFASDRFGPSARQVPGGEPFVVWPGRTTETPPRDGIFLQLGDASVQVDTPGNAFIPVSEPVGGLQAVYTNTNPAAVWMTSPPTGGVRVFAGTDSGQPPAELAQCNNDTAYTPYGLRASHTLGDLWTLSWSKQATTFTAENTVIQCTDGSCVDRSEIPLGTACSEDMIATRVTEGVSHLVVESFPDPTNADFLYQVILLGATQGTTSTLALVANRIDISLADTGTTRIGTATLTTTSAGRPDWPEVALLPPDKIGVSWIDPVDEDLSQTARFARYRICP